MSSSLPELQSEDSQSSSSAGPTLNASTSSLHSDAEALKQKIAEEFQSHEKEGDKTLTDEDKSEMDSRSVHVGGVDYSVTQNDLQHLFEKCGDINRITIMTEKSGKPKGFAYIEFVHPDSVARALELTETILKSRAITVSQKRTNVPGMKRGRGGGPAGMQHRGGLIGYVPMAYGARGGMRGGPHRGGFVRGAARSHPYTKK